MRAPRLQNESETLEVSGRLIKIADGKGDMVKSLHCSGTKMGRKNSLWRGNANRGEYEGKHPAKSCPAQHCCLQDSRHMSPAMPQEADD